MKNKLICISRTITAVVLLFGYGSAAAQCATTKALGSAFNMYTQLYNNTNPVAADKNLNTVVFVHRQNPNQFGGNSGNYRYDVSTDGGNSWSINNGVLNPASNSLGRYPNGAIYNPANNTNPSNAYVAYLGATFSGAYWDGIVTGVRKLNGTGNTESYNQPGMSSYYTAGSLVRGAQGVFWSIDRSSDGTYGGWDVQVYKGTWNGLNDVDWNPSAIFVPSFNSTLYGIPTVGALRIAFDPTGNIGWVCLLTHLTTGPSAYGYYPVFYKTVNGGNTWSGPFNVNLAQLGCITASISPGSTPSAYHEASLAVDSLGNPHLLAVIGHNNNAYSLNWNAWYHLFDITQVNNQWTAHPVSGLRGSPAVLMGSSSATASSAMCPQVSRSADGRKIFFSWTDNSSYTQGAANTSPNLFSRAFDIRLNKWTQTKDFTSCNFGAAGRVFFNHVAEQVLEPSAGQYKLAPVFGQSSNGTDTDAPANFTFLDNCTFSASEFTVNPLGMSIAQGTAALLCPGNTINLQVLGTFQQIQWTNGPASSIYPITTPGTYIATAGNGCTSSTAAIIVTALTLNTSGNTAMCAGSTATLTVSGSAPSYTWMPGSVVSPSLQVSPSANTNYTAMATGYGGCIVSSVVNITVNPSPVLIITPNKGFICPGHEVVLQASGANTFLWNTGAGTSSIVVTPAVSTVYTVTGTSNNGCVSTHTFNLVVDPCLGLDGQVLFNSFLIFPNPSQGTFFIHLEAGDRVMVFNELGETVCLLRAEEIRNNLAEVRNLAKGVYIVCLQNGATRKYQKLIVE